MMQIPSGSKGAFCRFEPISSVRLRIWVSFLCTMPLFLRLACDRDTDRTLFIFLQIRKYNDIRHFTSGPGRRRYQDQPDIGPLKVPGCQRFLKITVIIGKASRDLCDIHVAATTQADDGHRLLRSCLRDRRANIF